MNARTNGRVCSMQMICKWARVDYSLFFFFFFAVAVVFKLCIIRQRTSELFRKESPRFLKARIWRWWYIQFERDWADLATANKYANDNEFAYLEAWSHPKKTLWQNTWKLYWQLLRNGTEIAPEVRFETNGISTLFWWFDSSFGPWHRIIRHLMN